MQNAALLLDDSGNKGCYDLAIQAQLKKIDNPELTPSGKIMSEINQSRQSFIEIAHQQSKTSISKQKQIEALTQPHFNDFLSQWNAHLEAP